MKYIVLKDFYDRFDNKKLNKIGDKHNPPNDERANQLTELGFIEQVVEKKKSTKKKKEVNEGEKS